MQAIDDYRWLLGPDATRWLSQAADWPEPLLQQAGRLRKTLTPARAALVLQQAALRRRARRKFDHPERMFFTPLGLEQATDQHVADYKARRFEQGDRALDLCCGIGGDLIMLARRGPVVGVDRDPLAALLAQANCQAVCPHDVDAPTPNLVCADATLLAMECGVSWHIDPDRRPRGRRGTHVADHEPQAAAIERMLAVNGHAALKLAPAAEPPPRWAADAELEWISRGGQCRQLVAWFGRLAGAPGSHRATVLHRAQPSLTNHAPAWTARSLVGQPGGQLTRTDRIEHYIYEPDPAVLAAGLTAVLAAEQSLAAVGSAAYLTGGRRVHDPALACFQVEDVLPYDVKRVRAWLRERRIGRLEIKKRGVPLDPQQLRRRLAPEGDQSATLLLARVGDAVRAILAHRISPSPPQAEPLTNGQ